ncbi:hypothetical protein QYH69_10900 [Paraburkholderia sp. SARCC-3016]|jgi:hypothetical protein|uniref:hypothetical protein n=1 Tax=Paraburkholderia sp. SARCC-3016 TaxID=3058611 RepID=UPI002809E4E9|nr:hypothetical protein [Paraburkholderia sp. SARCC-3016]MDQ7977748.1 hypothetical protein [Paraburkholderia sp. SARCC-3016]
MRNIRSIRFALPAAASTLLATALVASTAFAAGGGQPLILDTQHGISDGQSGIVLQNAPLSQEPIVQAAPAAQPAQLAPYNQSTPIYVAPYINLPTNTANGGRPPHAGGLQAPRPTPQPRLPQ